MFDNFEQIISINLNNNDNIAESFHKKIEYNKDFTHLDSRYTQENYEKFIKDLIPNIDEKFKCNFMPCYPNYDFFKNNCKLFYEDKLLIKPYESDYINIKSQFNDKKLVCINGRNAINKHTARNNTLFTIIEKLIKEGYFVVNCTILPPNFNFDSKSYFELPENSCYNEVVALFANAHCVISIQNAGGISTHLLTQANFILLPCTESWVNNINFGFLDKTQVQLRKEKGYFTEIISEENIIKTISNLNPPENCKFSNPNKIIF